MPYQTVNGEETWVIPKGEEYKHRVDVMSPEVYAELTRPADPVLGLLDVMLDYQTRSPRTVYLKRNDDRSGVVGILSPKEFISKVKSRVGARVEGVDDDKVPYVGEVVWDGASPSPASPTPIGYDNVEGSKPIYREHSKGLLLGHYDMTGALWAGIAVGRGM